MQLATSRTRRRTATHVRTGAPIGVVIGEDWPSVRTYADRIDFYVRALQADAKAQLVWDDPAQLKAKIDAANAAGGFLGGVAASTLQVEYDLLTARIKKRGGDAQAAKDVAWTQQWTAWKAQWDPWTEAMHSVSPAGVFTTKTLTPDQAWQTQQTFETQLRGFYASFLALGGTVTSYTLPATLAMPTGDKEAGIPWTEILTIGGVIAVAAAWNAVRK